MKEKTMKFFKMQHSGFITRAEGAGEICIYAESKQKLRQADQIHCEVEVSAKPPGLNNTLADGYFKKISGWIYFRPGIFE